MLPFLSFLWQPSAVTKMVHETGRRLSVETPRWNCIIRVARNALALGQNEEDAAWLLALEESTNYFTNYDDLVARTAGCN